MTETALRLRTTIPWRRAGVVFAVAAILSLVFFYFLSLGPGVDWHNSFRPAVLEFLSLRNPYAVLGFFGPPWALLPLAPLAILPESIGSAFLVVLGVSAYTYAAIRLGATRLTLPLVVLTPFAYICLKYGNLDWMVVLGFVLPPQIGLFFVLVKPQIGGVVALFWIMEAWRAGGIKKVVRLLSPVSAAFLLSFLIYGLWPLKTTGLGLQDAYWNVSLWPASIPLGLVLLTAALRIRKFNLAILASPFLAPYVGPYTWSIIPFGLLPSRLEVVAAWAGLWLFYLLS